MVASDHPRLAALKAPLSAYDIYIERWVLRGTFKAAFAEVFRAPPRNLCFRISDWVDQSAPIAMAYRFMRVRFSLKVNFIVAGNYPMALRLHSLAQRLDSNIAIDIGTDWRDTTCLLLTPNGALLSGALQEFGRERPDGCRAMRFEAIES